MLDEHRRLMDEWKARPNHERECFIEDGIIDRTRWLSAKRKVLFVLKEARDDSGDKRGFDLCELIRDCWKGPGKSRTYCPVADWAYLAQNCQETTIPSRSEARRHRDESLLSSAVMNLKKSKGQKTSNLVDIVSNYVQPDADLIKRQIEIIAPEIIVCGG